MTSLVDGSMPILRYMSSACCTKAPLSPESCRRPRQRLRISEPSGLDVISSQNTLVLNVSVSAIVRSSDGCVGVKAGGWYTLSQSSRACRLLCSYPISVAIPIVHSCAMVPLGTSPYFFAKYTLLVPRRRPALGI